MKLPIFETVLNGITAVALIVGTRTDLRGVFELHAAGRTRVLREVRPLADDNEAIADVEAGRVATPILFEPSQMERTHRRGRSRHPAIASTSTPTAGATVRRSLRRSARSARSSTPPKEMRPSAPGALAPYEVRTLTHEIALGTASGTRSPQEVLVDCVTSCVSALAIVRWRSQMARRGRLFAGFLEWS